MADKKYISKVKLPGSEDVYDLTLPSDADLSINSVTASQFTGPLSGKATSAGYADTAGSATSATTAGNVTGTVAIANGGTGATAAAGARTNLGVYSKDEVNSLISGIDQFEYTVVTALPAASASTMHKIYLLAHSHGTSDSYDEYITLESSGTYSWEKLGNTDIDLSGYSKTSHTHTVSTSGSVSVSGSYDKATGVTISKGTGTANYTPDGSVSISRSADVAVNTVSVNSLTSSGSLPTLTGAITTAAEGDIAYVAGVSASHNLSVSHSDPTFNSATVNSLSGTGSLPSLSANTTASGGTAFITGLSKAGYTPTGSVGSTFTGTAATLTGSLTPAGSVSLGSNTTATGGVKYIEEISHTGASAGSTANFVTGISGGSGSLTSVATQTTGDLAYVESITSTGASASTTSINSITGAGSVATLTGGNTSGDIAYISAVSGGGASGTSNGVTITGSVTDGVLSLSASTTSNYVTGVNGVSATTKYLKFSGGSVPTYAAKTVVTGVSGGTTTATTKYLHHTHTGASASSTGSAVTSISGGSISPTYKYFHPGFTGDQGSVSISYTPAGTVSSSFTGTKDTSLVTGGTTNYLHFSAGSLPSSSAVSVLTGIKAAGSASLTGGVSANPTLNYLRFSQGALPGASAVTVASGIKTQPSFTGTFTGTGAQLVATPSYTSTSITSTGTASLSGTTSAASE